MPMLFSFLNAVCPTYGAVLDDDVSVPDESMFDEDSNAHYFAYQFWQRLWRNSVSCGFLGAELAQLVDRQSDVFTGQEESALLTRLPTGGVWFTEPGTYRAWSYREDLETTANYIPERLADILATIPDSAVFPASDPPLTPGP